MTPFEQGAAIQKAVNETLEAYKKRVAESDKIKANIDKTPTYDSAYPKKVGKLEKVHEDLASLSAESGVLDDSRRNGVPSAMDAAYSQAGRLVKLGADGLAELKRRPEFLRLKPVPPFLLPTNTQKPDPSSKPPNPGELPIKFPQREGGASIQGPHFITFDDFGRASSFPLTLDVDAAPKQPPDSPPFVHLPYRCQKPVF